MDEEIEPVFALWQKIVQAQLLWLRVVSDAHGVPIRMRFYEQKGFVSYSGPFNYDGHAFPEIDEMRKNVDWLYGSVSYDHTEPRRFEYRIAEDLWGRTATRALCDIGRSFIDCVLIGPLRRASALLASDPVLYRLAREHADGIQREGDGWLPIVRERIAMADSLMARQSIELLLKGMQ